MFSTSQRVSDLICDNIIYPVSNLVVQVGNQVSSDATPVTTYTSLPISEPVNVVPAGVTGNITSEKVFFVHLRFANQTYWQHFKSSMNYSWRAFSSSVYFFIHAFWPDIFQHHGSDGIVALSDELIENYEQRIKVIAERYATG